MQKVIEQLFSISCNADIIHIKPLNNDVSTKYRFKKKVRRTEIYL